MSRRLLSLASASLLTIVSVACSQQSASPSAPTTAVVAEAVAPGVGVKTTAPALISPAAGIRTNSLTPEFVVGSAAARHLASSPAFEYRVEIQTATGQFVASSDKLTAGSNGQVRWTLPVALQLDSPYRWRARAELGDRPGPWSEFSSFLSLDYRGLNPRPANGAWPSSGPDVVAYIADAWPEYLVRTATLAERIEHMEFLRDRIIEAGICGGLDLARNLKRGIGPHSHDAIAWRKPNGFVEVVDIASAFDDKNVFLSLHWSIVSGPSGYDRYRDHPGC
jgi:hypothetical protein